MKMLEPTVHQKLKAANDLATDKTIMLYNSFFFTVQGGQFTLHAKLLVS